MDEILSFKKERLAKRNSRGVRKAITKVETCPVAHLAETAECATGQLTLFDINRNQLNARPNDETIKIVQALHAVARFDNQ